MQRHGDVVGRGAGSDADPGDHAALGVADAVLYEGYLLYPYRRSSGKNRVRWQFGVLLPPAWARAHGLTDDGVSGAAESWYQRTDCLLEPAGATTLHVRLRFLQVQRRAGEDEPGFDAAVPHDLELEVALGDVLGDVEGDACPIELGLPGGQDVDDSGVVRRWRPLTVRVHLAAEACDTPFPLLRVRVRVENADTTTDPEASREEALLSALVATHTLASAPPGRFLSLIDPPAWAADAARACRSVHTFPVLAGDDRGDDVLLSSPIILEDHPRIAPESPGDLFDAGEIDEILTLRTLTLTDDEKREAHATDPRAAELLDRVDHLPPEALDRLHGAVRYLRPASRVPTLEVAGTVLGPGSRVRLWPRRRGTDAHDMFLQGRTGVVHEVLDDVDGSRFLSVTVDDDPGAELHRWYGRTRHFRPEEVEPLSDADARGRADRNGGPT